MIADRRLWLTADRSRIVEEGDPDAATLYAAPGHKIPDEAAKRFGIKRLKGTVEDKAAAPEGDKKPKGGLTVRRLRRGRNK